ncbi:MAG: macro domain-containing protein [Sedimentisphaerales bacterium]|nr:macro domain-containing protein [Sedimentisphaerales bacterium]
MKVKVKDTIIGLIQGDITEMDVDAIVNPANSRLVMGGGVAGAIRRKGGPSIQQECDRIGGTPVGTAVITGAGNLKARYVIHAVGPRMGEGQEETKLANATLNSLRLADSKGLSSIAFPAISTGIFGYPMDRCASVMLKTTVDYLAKTATGIKQVLFVLFDHQALLTFEARMSELARDLGLEVEQG